MNPAATRMGNARKHNWTHLNGLLSAGHNAQGALGGGYAGESSYNYFQGVIGVTKALQVAIGANMTLALTDSGLYEWGANSESGQGGFGVTNVPREIPAKIVGGLPLYTALTLGPNKAGKTFAQPEGPIGPLMNDIIAVSAGGATCAALKRDGRVTTWGSNSAGQLGNGWNEPGVDPQAAWESGEWRPQYAPGLVLTGPGPGSPSNPTGAQEIAPGETNVLKGVIAIAAAHQVIFYLRRNPVNGFGEVWYSGQPASGSTAVYATKDTLGDFAASNPLAIAASRNAYSILFGDGTLKNVGINSEGLWGEGEGLESEHGRKVGIPQTSPGVPLGKIIAVAMAEYSCKALDNEGYVWTWGSNGEPAASGIFHEEAQQGLGPREAPVLRPTRIPGLEHVIAIASNGEVRGNGEFGGDVALALLQDKTVRSWGKQYDLGAARSSKGEVTGILGDKTGVNKNVPTNPGLSNIVGIATGAIAMTLTQEPGTPPTPSVRVTSPASGKLRVEWNQVPGTVGTLPLWREAQGWKVTYKESTGSSHTVELAAEAEKKVEVTSAAGSTTVKVVETQLTEEPIPVGGATKTASSGKITVERPAWTEAEPTWFVESQRTEAFAANSLATLVLSAPLEVGHSYESLPCRKLNQAIPSGTILRLQSGSNSQDVETSAEAAKEALSIPIVAATASFAFPTLSSCNEVRSMAGPTLSTGSPITSIKLSQPLLSKVLAGSLIKLDLVTHHQLFEVTSTAAVGEETISVASETPNFAYTSSTRVVPSEQDKWIRANDEIPGTSTTYMLTLPTSPNGLTGEQANVRISGSFLGAFGTRAVTTTVLA